MPETIQVLRKYQSGDPTATTRLVDQLYGELRAMAARQISRFPQGSLQPTAIVHELYLRLIHDSDPTEVDRAHFLAVASGCIRNILLEHARRKATQKRGGGSVKVTLEDSMSTSEPDLDLLALEEAMEQLADRDERQARVVQLRFFGGMSIDEAALALDVPPGTIKNDWRFARAWLFTRLSGQSV